MLAWCSYLADNTVVDMRSPTVTISGALLQVRHQSNRSGSSTYYVKLPLEGSVTPWILWLGDRHPIEGTQVSMDVHAWDLGDPVTLKILSGPSAGFTRQANSTVRIDWFLLAGAGFLLVVFTVWWLVFSARVASSAERQAIG